MPVCEGLALGVGIAGSSQLLGGVLSADKGPY